MVGRTHLVHPGLEDLGPRLTSGIALLGPLLAQRRKGLGHQLLWASLTALENVDAVQLEVRSSNVAARALYGSLGFSETGSRPKYYATPDGREDAILMTLTLNHGGSVT